MISLDSEHLCLLELIKASLFDSVPNLPKEANWESVFECAKVQCIVPLVASCVPVEHRNMWFGLACQNKAHFMQMIYEQNILVKLFKEVNIPVVVLKGSSAAIYYPNPSLRTFGDIDLYVSERDLKTARKLLKVNGYNFTSKDYRHYEFVKNNLDVELHYKFSSKIYKDIEHIVLNGLYNSVEYNIANYSFSGLPAYENGLVLLGHIMQHLKTSGIGLRQIIDWMMFVHKELDDSAWDNHFKALAVEAGLDKLAITTTFMCRKWLGLPDRITWCDVADEQVADQLLIRVLDDGNFGHDRAPVEVIKHSIKNEGFFSYLQREGLENWRLAQKCVLFRPLAWLYQLCRYIFKGIAGYFSGKKLFMKDKHNMSLDELWKRLE